MNTMLTAALGNSTIILYVIFGVLIVAMVASTFISGKKRKKQAEAMRGRIVAGARVMTIGRLIGTIISIDESKNEVVLNAGTAESPTYITISREGVGTVLDTPAAVAPASSAGGGYFRLDDENEENKDE